MIIAARRHEVARELRDIAREKIREERGILHDEGFREVILLGVIIHIIIVMAALAALRWTPTSLFSPLQLTSGSSVSSW